jgi:hypothetical protein
VMSLQPPTSTHMCHTYAGTNRKYQQPVNCIGIKVPPPVIIAHISLHIIFTFKFAKHFLNPECV